MLIWQLWFRGNSASSEPASNEPSSEHPLHATYASGAESNVIITLKKLEPEAAPEVIYEGRPDGAICHRGEIGSVIALKNELDQFAQKYDFVQFGGTGPAPTPTSSPANECLGKPDGTPCEGGCAPPDCRTGCTEGKQCTDESCTPFQVACDPYLLFPDESEICPPARLTR